MAISAELLKPIIAGYIFIGWDIELPETMPGITCWEAFATDSSVIILKRPCGRIHINEIANRVEIQQTPDFSLDNIK